MNGEPALLSNKQLFNNIDVTLEPSSINDIGEFPGFCVHLIWTGTPTGTITIAASNDNSNWVTVQTQATGGAASQLLVNVERAHYRYLKISYAHSASVGNITGYLSAKRSG